MTDWQTWPKCGFLTFFFLFFPEQQTCQIWIGHSFVQYDKWNLIFGWWTRYKTEHRVEEVCCSKCFIVSVMSFHVYFDKQVHKKNEKKKKLSKKKIESLNFAESNVYRKNKRARQLWDIQFIFFSLTGRQTCQVWSVGWFCFLFF